MNKLNSEAQHLNKLKELEQKYSDAKLEYLQEQQEIMSRIRENKNNLEWIIVNEEFICLINSDIEYFFQWIKENFNEDEDLLEEIKMAFLNDVKMSVLMDEAIEIGKVLGNKKNNDQFREFFETLNSIVATEKSNMHEIQLDNIETNLYLKTIKPFIIFVLIYSKKNSKSVIKRFNGFKLINSKLAKIGENRIYSNSRNDLNLFLEWLIESKDIDKALCMKFFDTYTDYIDIHYLAKEIYIEELNGIDKKIKDQLKILTKIKSPLMKNLLMNSCYNVDFLLRPEVLETYISIFDECKVSLKKSIINTEKSNKKEKELTMYIKLKEYKKIFDSLGYNEKYLELVDDLIIDLNLIEEDEEDLDIDPYEKEVFLEKIFGVKGSYSINHFGAAYRMIYNEKNCKSKK
ncbi:hypothetical protein [Bacillus pacificus]|uniref:hypothetical protein n=1 Tax=Bacillus pacificus TaxID=2026187 RepID=UPI0020919B97|nr:hypothetical protein [Bacillus pacificus]